MLQLLSFLLIASSFTWLSLLPRQAHAGDGRLEINQSCATLTGCFDDDGVGFPVQITQPGSYLLTGNLTLQSASSTAILISADGVTIDLGGFEIRGVTSCSTPPVTCTNEGVGRGVDGQLVEQTRVFGGRIVGMGQIGVAVGNQSAVSDVEISHCGNYGISSGGSVELRDNRVSAIGGYGISTGSGSLVVDNTIRHTDSGGIQVSGSGSVVRGNATSENGSYGMIVNGGSTVIGNLSSHNEQSGISAGAGSLIADNTVTSNDFEGVFCNQGCTIRDNAVYQNGDEVNTTFDDGITCGSGCTVRGNAVRGGAGYGLNLGTDSVYRENVITENALGQVIGTGSNGGNNRCAGPGTVSSSCP